MPPRRPRSPGEGTVSRVAQLPTAQPRSAHTHAHEAWGLTLALELGRGRCGYQAGPPPDFREVTTGHSRVAGRALRAPRGCRRGGAGGDLPGAVTEGPGHSRQARWGGRGARRGCGRGARGRRCCRCVRRGCGGGPPGGSGGGDGAAGAAGAGRPLPAAISSRRRSLPPFSLRLPPVPPRPRRRPAPAAPAPPAPCSPAAAAPPVPAHAQPRGRLPA